MKVLMINAVCGIGSTGRICTDLADEYEKQGFCVKIAYGRGSVPKQYERIAVKIGNDFNVKTHVLKARLLDADGLGSKSSTKKFIKWLKEFDPDVIHLHNLHGYFINIPELFNYIVSNNKKVIWTLHDLWTVTGHSATCDQVNCRKWQTGCFDCPLTKGYPMSLVDKSDFNYKWKKELFTSVKDLTIVTPSKWLADIVKKSFLKSKNIITISNGIDTTVFHPVSSRFRKKYSLENKIILLGCASAWGKLKGLEDFKILSQKLNNRFQIVLIGLTQKQIKYMPSNIICLEMTQNISELAEIYSASDLFINLTYADVFSMVNREALCCGTPVLTYETGGASECIDKNNGIPFRKGDLNAIINYLNGKYSLSDFSLNVEDESKTLGDTEMKKKYVNLLQI